MLRHALRILDAAACTGAYVPGHSDRGLKCRHEAFLEAELHVRMEGVFWINRLGLSFGVHSAEMWEDWGGGQDVFIDDVKDVNMPCLADGIMLAHVSYSLGPGRCWNGLSVDEPRPTHFILFATPSRTG